MDTVPGALPPLLLILGTDLAGKDHCANVVADTADAAGVIVERRRGAFSGRTAQHRTSEHKPLFALWLEWLFLATLPLHCWLLPYVTAWLIFFDLRRFSQPQRTSVLVVSHTALRLLAFALGHRFERTEQIQLPAITRRALQAIIPATSVVTVALDIDHRVREKRMAERAGRGTVDHFDRYMASDPGRSERIEQFLVWIGQTFLNAITIVNNDLSDAELLAQLQSGLSQPPSPHPSMNTL